MSIFARKNNPKRLITTPHTTPITTGPTAHIPTKALSRPRKTMISRSRILPRERHLPHPRIHRQCRPALRSQ